MEIKRGFIGNLVLLHNKTVECEALWQVHEYISRLAPTPRRHLLGTMLGEITAFYKSIADKQIKGAPDRAQKYMLAAMLRTRIRRFWNAFEKLVDVVVDDVECYKHTYTLKPPRLVKNTFDNSFRNCDDFKPGICRLRLFCNEQEDNLVAISSALSALPSPDAESTRRLTEIKQVVRNKKQDVLRAACWRMGDAIIVLEAPSGAVIVHGNCKHFDPICHAVDRTSVCYRQHEHYSDTAG